MGGKKENERELSRLPYVEILGGLGRDVGGWNGRVRGRIGGVIVDR